MQHERVCKLLAYTRLLQHPRLTPPPCSACRLADPRFLQRLGIEEAISISTTLAAQYQKRGTKFWSERTRHSFCFVRPLEVRPRYSFALLQPLQHSRCLFCFPPSPIFGARIPVLRDSFGFASSLRVSIPSHSPTVGLVPKG